MDPQELTRRLNAAIIEARYYGHRSGGRRRLAHARGDDGDRSQSKSPSEASSPRHDVRQSTLNPFNVARSTLIFDPARGEDDQMSRVANALRALKDADPDRPLSIIAQENHSPIKTRPQSRTQSRNGYTEAQRSAARKSIATSVPKIVEVEKSVETAPRPQSTVAAPNIAEAVKKRASRKAPAPLILTVVPKATKPAMVDVSSPLTTKPTDALPNLEPLSPFGATFSENGGSFLVYQPKEVRHSAILTDSPTAMSPEPEGETPYSMEKNLSPMVGTARRSSPPSPATVKPPADYFSRPGPPQQDIVEMQDPLRVQKRPVVSEEDEQPSQAEAAISRRRKSIPGVRLSQNSETDGTDEGMSPVFETSQAQSSRTSLGQPLSASQPGLKRMPSKRIGFTPEEFQDLGIASALSETVPRTPLDEVPAAPVSPLQLPAQDYPSPEDEHVVSPITSLPLEPIALPKRLSSLPQAQESTLNTKRFSIPRKAVGSGAFEGSFNEGTIRPVFPLKQSRHDSTGFTVAREFIRDSIDSEHVRHVHSAAQQAGDNGVSSASHSQYLPKLTTSLSKPGKTEQIADGIVLINSDSPIVNKQMMKLPAPSDTRFREPSYTKELIVSPDASRHNSIADTTEHCQLSLTRDTIVRPPSGTLDANVNDSAALRRVPSRDRRHTDATITSMSARPDYRARPLIQDAPEMPVSPAPLSRPRTAGARGSQPFEAAPLPAKLPSKIKFPPRANIAELGAMSPESLKLLHEQEALLRRRYDAVLNPIDDALMKKPQPALEIGPNGMPLQSPKKHKHARSKSSDIRVSLGGAAVSTTDLDLIRNQENIAREQAAIRMQRRNLGAAARWPSAPTEEFGGYYEKSPVPMDQHYGVYGGYGVPVNTPMGFPSPAEQTKSAFTFDDDTQVRKRRPTWKFWKKR